MEAPRLQITGRLRAIMRYDKMAGEVPRVLILRSQYWLDGACETAARSLGWQITSVPIPMEGALKRDQIAQLLDAVVTTRPDFILAINLAGMDLDGLWARFFEDLELPYVGWFVDDPRTILMDRTTYCSPHTLTLTWEETYIPYLRELGFPHVHWLPLAADTALFNAGPETITRHPPTFVGNSMAAYADRAWQPIAANPALLKLANDALGAGSVTRSNFGLGLSRIVGAVPHHQLNAEERRALEMLFFIEGTRRYRREAIESLAGLGVQVRGDDEWKHSGAESLPSLSYADELPAFYRQCAVNLNLTSIQMASAVNQRVFDCPAAGGFLLTDAQSDLERLFDPDTDLAVFSNLEECREKLLFYRNNSSARSVIINNARKRILQEHTYIHRLRTIARWVMQYFG